MEIPQIYNNLFDNKIDKIEEEQFFKIVIKSDDDNSLSKQGSFEEFLGEDDESTEISSLVAEIDASCSRSSMESESGEIINILKAPAIIFQPFRTLQPKRISLSGKVLTMNTDYNHRVTPERMSNPIFKNINREM
jgi:hypothetical protein